MRSKWTKPLEYTLHNPICLCTNLLFIKFKNFIARNFITYRQKSIVVENWVLLTKLRHCRSLIGSFKNRKQMSIFNCHRSTLAGVGSIVVHVKVWLCEKKCQLTPIDLMIIAHDIRTLFLGTLLQGGFKSKINVQIHILG